MSKNNQSTPVYILKIAYPLVVICAIIALLVAAVNSVTEPVIEGMAEAERNWNAFFNKVIKYIFK